MKYNSNINWCTAWPDKWGDIDFSLCCYRHDVAYGNIIKMSSFIDRTLARRVADYKLMK